MTKILFDPGHSYLKLGAPSHWLGLNEHDLKLIQARAAYKILQEQKFEIQILDPDIDDLVKIGTQAAACDAFVSFHLNSCLDAGVNYTTVCLHETKSKNASKRLGSQLILALIKTIQIAPYRGPFGPGLMYLPLKVLSAAENACKGPCVLTEAFFVSSETWKTQDELKRQAEKAGVCIGQTIANYFATTKR